MKLVSVIAFAALSLATACGPNSDSGVDGRGGQKSSIHDGGENSTYNPREPRTDTA